MLHKEFWGLLFLAFVAWIFLSSDGSTRIYRTCRPVGWAGNVAVSVTAFAAPRQQSHVKNWMDKVDYGCQYTAWRLIYQDDYNRYQQQQGQTALSQTPPVQLPGPSLGTTVPPAHP
jgi:hypothetical protein